MVIHGHAHAIFAGAYAHQRHKDMYRSQYRAVQLENVSSSTCPQGLVTESTLQRGLDRFHYSFVADCTFQHGLDTNLFKLLARKSEHWALHEVLSKTQEDLDLGLDLWLEY